MIKNWYRKYGYIVFLIFVIGAPFNMKLGIAALICMLAPIFFSLAGKGRYWCGNYCPRGNFYQNVLGKISTGRKVPSFLRSKWFRIFMILLILFNFSLGIYKNWGSPVGIGMVFYRIIVMTSIVGIVLGIFYSKRAWCGFCPMGTIAGYISKVKGRNLNVAVSESCVSCKLCKKTCPMGISPDEYKNAEVKDMDCILCEACVYQCPKGAIKIR